MSNKSIDDLCKEVNELRELVEKIRRKVLPTNTEAEQDELLAQVMRENLRNYCEGWDAK